MTEDVRKLAYDNLRHKLLIGGFMAVFSVGLWVADVLGFSIFPKEQGEPMALRSAIYLGMIVVTGLWLLVGWRRAQRLAQRGVVVEGFITSKSVIKKHGECPTTVSYEVNGTTFTKRKDMSSSLLIGTPVRVLYDAANPARAEILDLSYRLSEK